MGKGGDTRGSGGVFLVRIVTCQFGLRAFILLGLVCFSMWESGQSRLLCGPVSLPVCLGDSINTFSHKAPSVCVCVCLNVCVRHMSVYTPCLKSTVQPISPLPIKASIIYPTTLFIIISRHFLPSYPVVVFTQKSYSGNAVFILLSAPLQYKQ